MRRIILLLALLLVVFSFDVSARRSENFSAADAYDWLIQQSDKGSYDGNIIDTSVAFLAIDAAGGLATLERDYIIAQENENHCWPKSGCKIEDTAWASLALHKAGESSYVTNTESWLKRAQTPTLTSGNWILQIDTPDTGTCTIKYKKGETELSKEVDVDEGIFPDCGGRTFFDLKNCLETGLLNNYASLELDIDCSALNNAKISIAYNSGSSYYLYEEVHETKAVLIVKNGCFGTGYKDPACKYDSSLYTEWVLSQIGSSLSSELYLRESYNQQNTIHNALLYIVTKDKSYAEELKKLQKTDGSWDSNSLNTAFAVLAFRSESEYGQFVEKAQDWLKEKQQDDGSWDGKILNTAMVLYSSFYQGVEMPSCTDGIKNQGERGIDCGGPCEAEPYSDDCCGNGVKDDDEEGIDCGDICDEVCSGLVCDDDGSCDDVAGEDCNNCPNDCIACEDLCSNGQQDTASAEEGVDCGGYCSPCGENVCNNDGNCEYDLTEKYTDYTQNEDSQNCPNDCYCGDGICDDYEKETGECTQDCGVSAESVCGDGICGSGEDVSCPDDCIGDYVCNNDGICDLELGEGCDCSDCEEEDFCVGERSGFMLILIILIILVVGGGVFFFVTKKRGKPKKPSYGVGPSFTPKMPEKPKGKGSFFSGLMKPKAPAQPQRPAYRAPPTQATPSRESRVDSALEKSIREAKKLIKGEK